MYVRIVNGTYGIYLMRINVSVCMGHDLASGFMARLNVFYYSSKSSYLVRHYLKFCIFLPHYSLSLSATVVKSKGSVITL